MKSIHAYYMLNLKYLYTLNLFIMIAVLNYAKVFKKSCILNEFFSDLIKQ